MSIPQNRVGAGSVATCRWRRAAAASLGMALLAAGLLPVQAPAQVVVKIEVVADRATVHLEPDGRSPVVETLDRGAVLKLSSGIKFRSNWYYVIFMSAKSGRTLTGYIPDEDVRKLNSTIKVAILTPGEAEIADPKAFDLSDTEIPEIHWGQAEDGILRTEGRPLSREVSDDVEFLRYHRNVFGKRCLISYVLADRKLISIRLRLLEKYANKDRYIADYNQIKDFLNKKVGEPRYDNVVWKDRAYAERGESLGVAVKSGSLSLSSEWVIEGTGVRISLTGENSEILFAAEVNDIKAKNPASF